MLLLPAYPVAMKSGPPFPNRVKILGTSALRGGEGFAETFYFLRDSDSIQKGNIYLAPARRQG